MKNHPAVLVKSVVLAVATFGILALSQGVARADEVFIAGYTNGCFNCATPIDTSGADQFDTLLGLTYYNSVFVGTTANGLRGLGGAPNTATTANTLGSFVLDDPPNTYGQTFSLLVTFTTPQGINGPNSATFTALLTGTVLANDVGGILLDFNNTPILFTFNDTNCEPGNIQLPGQQTTCGVGSFLFSVNDLAMDPGKLAGLTGQITAAQQTSAVPEPATLLLLGTGLTGIAAKLRKRKKARAEES